MALGEGGVTGVDEMDIVGGAEKISLKKTGADWAASDGRKVQQSKVSDLLSAIQTDRATSIVDSPKAPGAYGLDKPRLEVVLREKGKERSRTEIRKRQPESGGRLFEVGRSPHNDCQ